MKISNLKEAEEFLYQRLPVFQNAGKIAYKPGLQRIESLLEQLNNPHKTVKCIHIAGTNGKGTCTNALAACLQKAGYRVGLFTSPHFINFTERIKVNGQNIDEVFVLNFLEQCKWEDVGASYFELLTALGFAYFNAQAVDVAVIEVGLGGRLDSTNICQPIVSAITGIGLDHTDVLGDSIEKIAVEKAGIKKPRVPLFVAPVEQSCKEAIFSHYGAEEIEYLDGNPSDNNNFLLVNTLLDYLSKPFPKLKTVDRQWCFNNLNAITGFQGRFQHYTYKNKKFVLDVGHNAPALKLLFKKVEECFGKEVIYLCGFSSDKDLSSIKGQFPKGIPFIPVQASVLRAKKYDECLAFFRSESIDCLTFEGKKYVNEILNEITDYQTDKTIIVCGSFFVVADAIKYFKENL